MKFSHLIAALLVSAPMFANADQTFVSTNDGKTLNIPANLFDTPAAKEFLSTGKNPYMNKADAMKAGKKVYQLYSCAQCHGPVGNGQVGPNLRDDTFNYAKNATDKGMFETLWAGAPAGMGAKGKGLMQPDDPSQGLTPDEILKVSAFLRSKADAAPAAEATPAAAPAADPAKEMAPAADATATPAAAPTEKPMKKAMKKKVKKVKKS
jgi:cytochrome c-L